MYNPPVRGREYIFYLSLVDAADTTLFKANPTLASGDVKISKDGGAEANLGTLPTVTPASGRHVKVTVSATEMDADNVSIVFHDAAGVEWCDTQVNIQPNATIGGGTCTTGGSTTSVTTSAFAPAPGAANAFAGRVLIFDNNTTTAALRGAAGTVTASTNSSTPTFTIQDALPGTPTTGDTFKIY